jgi:hypothetical protein
MTAPKIQPRRLSAANTKQEMLDAYNALVQQLQEQRETELKPEERAEEREKTQAVAVADTLSVDGVVQAVGTLKAEAGRLLTQLSDRLEEEVAKYRQITRAVEVKSAELAEIYEIQRAASSLVALIAAQDQKRQEFEAEMAARREALTREIETMRAEWERERSLHDAAIKERDAAEAKQRQREKEEYQYSFQREQQLAKEQFQDEKARLEREIQYRREEMERELADREQAVARREAELNDLRQQVEGFPKQLDAAVARAVKEAVDRVQLEARSREELAKREFEGERNVLNTRIESLEKTVKEQNEQIARLSQQSEKAYGQVQEIAVRAIEGSSNLRAMSTLQPVAAEQPRKVSAEP